jgi:pimeloyl-ACP methyl ester carboxylesterase
MAAPQPAMAVPREITHKTTNLIHKSNASIHYIFARGPPKDNILVVFLNGLMTDAVTWLPVIAGIIRQRKGSEEGFPSMLSYDRYGQGMTEDRDPQDQGKERGHGHDCADAAEDLRRLLDHIAMEEMGTRVERLRIVLVANSIGCAIGRLYAQGYPVTALLMLDSIMANSTFDFWPDPEAPGFSKAELPEDVTVEVLREQRAKFAAIFRPDGMNKEGLSRRDLAKLLPDSDGPMLGKKGDRPLVTVVGHGFEAFAKESLKTMGTPIGLSMKFSNPIWHKYNQGLAQITDKERSKGPIQAKGCGHFIQRDDPALVVSETLELVDKVRRQESAIW